MLHESAANRPAEMQDTITRLTSALRTLEEHQRAGLAPRADVIFFIGGLDRALTVEERAYTGMVFAACREHRDELTDMLGKRLGVGRGGVIAAIRAHLAATFTHRVDGGVPATVVAYLDGLRAQVLAKASRLR